MASSPTLEDLLKEKDEQIKNGNVEGAKAVIRIKLNKKTVKQLQDICKQLKIPANGRKVEIIGQIMNTMFKENKENQNLQNELLNQSPPKSNLYEKQVLKSKKRLMLLLILQPKLT
jgi:RNA-binding protein YhbY